MRLVSRAWEAEVLPLNYTAWRRFYESGLPPGNQKEAIERGRRLSASPTVLDTGNPRCH